MARRADMKVRHGPAMPVAWLAVAMLLTVAAYWTGLSGGYLFDDYPNIVNNQALHLHKLDAPGLVGAANSSPSSELKRPLTSISFALNHFLTGLDPFWMKATNLAVHLLNGLLIYLLAKQLLRLANPGDHHRKLAALIAAVWLVLPIHLSVVLYVVQRMESLANLFVLVGLVCYLLSRERMRAGRGGLWGCVASLVVPTGLGVLAKEPAIMLPFYAFCMEWLLFGFRTSGVDRPDHKVLAMFGVLLGLPFVLGMAWLMPDLLLPEAWASRDFTLGSRLLTEARIVVAYIHMTLLPTPWALSFYHDQVAASTGLFSPISSFASLAFLLALVASICLARRRAPLVSIGLALFLGGQLLTGTVLPLDLAYEHRNYFASFGLLLVAVPLLAVSPSLRFAPSRKLFLGVLFSGYFALTAFTAYIWGDPLRLASDLAARNPTSPRAQYELGFTYLVYSGYERESPFTDLARSQLELAAALPRSPILAEQALIMINARMGLPQNDEWWKSLATKLARRSPSPDDISALASLGTCEATGRCNYQGRTLAPAFLTALSHPRPRPILLATYAEYAWKVLRDPELALRMAREAAAQDPDVPAYQITVARMLIALDRHDEASVPLAALAELNRYGELDAELKVLSEALHAP